jgi:hypothetical protein
MDRIDLYVPPEEYAEVKASGACWDNDSKRWYIAGDTAYSALAKQLERWPYFRKGMGAESEEENFVNHCPNCGAMQDDSLLHSEPGDVFFSLAHGTPGSVEFTPLAGRIQVNGDYGFEV